MPDRQYGAVNSAPRRQRAKFYGKDDDEDALASLFAGLKTSTSVGGRDGPRSPYPAINSHRLGGPTPTTPRARTRNVSRSSGTSRALGRIAPKGPKNNLPTPGIYTPRGGGIGDMGPIIDPFADMPGMETISFEDALSQARGIIGDSGLKDALSIIAGRESALKGQAGDSTARINAMYKQLENSIRGDQGAIDKNAADARASISATGAASQAAAKEAYNATQAAQAELRNRLGTQSAEMYEAAGGNQDADIYQGDVSRSAARTEAANTEITRNEQAAEDRLTGDVAAVGLEGRSQASNIQSQLMQLLGQLQDERSQTTNQYNQQANQAALALAQDFMSRSQQDSSNRYQQWLDRQRLMRDDANTAWEQGMAENQFGLEQMQAQARNQPQAPDLDDYSPNAQFNYQQAQNLGQQNAGKVASAIAKNATFINGKPSVNAQRAIQELIASGLTPQQAQQAVSDYMLAMS